MNANAPMKVTVLLDHQFIPFKLEYAFAKQMVEDWAAWKRGDKTDYPKVLAGDSWTVESAKIVGIYAVPWEGSYYDRVAKAQEKIADSLTSGEDWKG